MYRELICSPWWTYVSGADSKAETSAFRAQYRVIAGTGASAVTQEVDVTRPGATVRIELTDR